MQVSLRSVSIREPSSLSLGYLISPKTAVAVQSRSALHIQNDVNEAIASSHSILFKVGVLGTSIRPGWLAFAQTDRCGLTIL